MKGIKAYVVNKDMKEFELCLGDLTDDERDIITKVSLDQLLSFSDVKQAENTL